MYPQEGAFIDELDNQDSIFDKSNPVILIDSEKIPIVAYFDEGPVKESQNVEYMYDYTTKIYTQDISDKDDEGEEDLSDDEGSSSSDSEDFSTESESDGLSYSGSVIDDEVAADYFEGIGGAGNIINVDQLVGQMSDEDSDFGDTFNETLQKLGGNDLQDASREYGMEKPILGRKSRKENEKSTPVKYAQSSSLDDLMFVKDLRIVSGKKKHVARPPQSQPFEARKSKKFRRIPREKKKHRKETIVVKRRDRMLRRGVDLQNINLIATEAYGVVDPLFKSKLQLVYG